MFAIIGGRVARILCFLRKYVPRAPIKVAMLPKITSHKAHPVKMFARMQPKAIGESSNLQKDRGLPQG